MHAASPRTGGRILVDQLAAQGVERVYCVPGKSYLAALDALYDSPIEVTVCRQEAGAAMMALTEGRLTGRPGVCFVTRGPGATNAAHGVHIAQHDSAPMILFVGQVERGDAWPRGLPGDGLPCLFRLGRPNGRPRSRTRPQIPEVVQRAFHIAMQGRPGPVVIALPEDMLVETATAPTRRAPRRRRSGRASRRWRSCRRCSGRPNSPVAILGGAGLDATARARPSRASPNASTCLSPARSAAPAPSTGNTTIMPARSASAPIRSSRRASRAADLVHARRRPHVGGGRPGLYAVRHSDRRGRRLVHVHADPHEIGRNYHPALASLRRRPPSAPRSRACSRPRAIPWAAETRQARADYLAWSEQAPPNPGRVQLGEIMFWLRRRVPDAIFTNGAGNFAIWVGPLPALSARSSSRSGRPPARWATACRRRSARRKLFPDRTVVCFAGDGDFLMNGQEFATAVQYGLPIVVIVIDNGIYGTIRMHQEREYPGRVIATELQQPRLRRLRPRLRRPRRDGRGDGRVRCPRSSAPSRPDAPSIIHVKIDPEAITPTTTLSDIRKAALGRAGAV